MMKRLPIVLLGLLLSIPLWDMQPVSPGQRRLAPVTERGFLLLDGLGHAVLLSGSERWHPALGTEASAGGPLSEAERAAVTTQTSTPGRRSRGSFIPAFLSGSSGDRREGYAYDIPGMYDYTDDADPGRRREEDNGEEQAGELPAPEPASLAMLALGLAVLALSDIARRKARARQ